MSQALWDRIDDYFGGALLAHDPVLNGALERSAAEGLPAIAVAPNQGALLSLLVRSIHGRRVLEVGALGGYSTIWLARALPADGRVVSLEIDPHHAAVARANVAAAGLADRVEIKTGRAADLLPGLASEPPFDFAYIDADKPSNPTYFEWALKLVRPGGLIVVDNVVREGAVVDASSADPNVIGVRRLVNMVAREPRVEATAIQTVGEKGHDGLLIARVRDAAGPFMLVTLPPQG